MRCFAPRGSAFSALQIDQTLHALAGDGLRHPRSAPRHHGYGSPEFIMGRDDQPIHQLEHDRIAS
jgi:hypothetical protein